MKLDKELVLAILSFLTKNQTITFLAIPLLLIYGAIKFSTQSFEGFALYGLLGVTVLIFSAWVISRSK